MIALFLPHLGRCKVTKLLGLNDQDSPQPLADVLKVDPHFDELVQIIDEEEGSLLGQFDPLGFPHLVAVTGPCSGPER